MTEKNSRGFFIKKLLTGVICVSMLAGTVTGCGAKSDASDTGVHDASVSSSETAAVSPETTDSTAETADSSSKTLNPDEIPSATDEVFAMDTYMTLTCYGEQCEEALSAAMDEITRLDDLLSVGNEDSEISLINQNGSGTVSEDTGTMIGKALEVYNTTGGAFDITVYPLMELWGFTTQDFAVPSQSAIDKLLPYVDGSKVDYDPETQNVSIQEGQGIDLGGIAKGFTSSRIMEIFESYDLVSGVISLGGNVQCYRKKTDGTLWRCGIKDPLSPDDNSAMLGIVEIEDKAVITSGAYERYFTDEKTGKTYHHIIDPSTGYPAESGIISSTIVSADGTLADALSTSCYIMGLDKASEYWKEYGDDFDMILMTEDQNVYVTEGLAENFTTDFPCTVIERED